MISTKLEVHNVLHGYQRRTEPGPQVTWTENLERWFLRQASRQTNRQTDTPITILCTPTNGEAMTASKLFVMLPHKDSHNSLTYQCPVTEPDV